jgi:hypothetical protein
MRGVFAAKADIITNPKYTAHIVLNMICNVVERFGASKSNPVVIAVDAKPSWRHHYYIENCVNFPEYLDPENPGAYHVYKGKRVKDPDIPWTEVMEVLNAVLDMLRQHSDFHVVEVPLCEADDVIAILARQCIENKEDCFLISSDKDFKQLQDGDYVQIYDPINQLFVPQIDVKQFKRYHILIGDKVDNIKACRPRLGEKTALKILPVIVETLKLDPEMRKRYKFNQVMIDFDFIPKDLVVNVVAEHQNSVMNHNFMGIMKFCQEYRLSAIADRIPSFKLGNVPKATKLNSVKQRERQILQSNERSLDAFFAD